MTARKRAPKRCWVSFCKTCGDFLVADRSKRQCETAVGCKCEGGEEVIVAVRAELGPTP